MRVFLVVLDSLGVGALPDAHKYGDEGSNTLGNIVARTNLHLPVLTRLGLGNVPGAGLESVPRPEGAFGRMAEAAPGKDTITGHWEMAGVVISEPFRTYPRGFPGQLLAQFSRRIGRGVLGNYPASGTEIIEELGREHIETGKPIVYTSADSVFQIAAHEEVIPLKDLYGICQIAREMLHGEHKVARVIARPFVGRPGAFVRTANRRDFSLAPEGPTVLDALVEQDRTVIGIGKIRDIFAGRGVTESLKSKDNDHGLALLLDVAASGRGDLVFANLVDFDALYGHRNDVAGYARALAAADAGIGRLLKSMDATDVLIITADHGCDPTYPGTDHTREYVPLLVWGRHLRQGVDLGTRATFADVAATIAELLEIDYRCPGTSFTNEVR